MASCDSGVLDDDYIRDQVIDKCYLSHLHCMLQVSRAGRFCNAGLPLKDCKGTGGINCQLREMDQNSNRCWRKNLGAAWNVCEGRGDDGGRNVGGERDAGGVRGDKMLKICFGCGREGHFTGVRGYPAHDQA